MFPSTGSFKESNSQNPAIINARIRPWNKTRGICLIGILNDSARNFLILRNVVFDRSEDVIDPMDEYMLLFIIVSLIYICSTGIIQITTYTALIDNKILLVSIEP